MSMFLLDLLTFVLEKKGVCGPTKGQYSAIADAGSESKRGKTNTDATVDTFSLALMMGQGFVAHRFSGNK